MKFGRIVLQVNMHRLTYGVGFSTWRHTFKTRGHDISRNKVLPPGEWWVNTKRLLAPMQQRYASSWSRLVVHSCVARQCGAPLTACGVRHYQLINVDVGFWYSLQLTHIL